MNKQQIKMFINELCYDLETLCILIDGNRLKETIPVVCKILSDIRSFEEQIKDGPLKNCFPEHWEEEDVRVKIEGFFKNGTIVSDQELKSIKYDLFLERLCSMAYDGIKELKRKIKSPLQKKIEIYLPILTVILVLTFISINNYVSKDWGLRVDFFQGENFEKYAWTGKNKTINFSSCEDMHSHTPLEHFSARWQGNLLVPKDGDYIFTVNVDDGARLFIDNQLIIESWKEQSPAEYHNNVFLKKGTHAIRVDYKNVILECTLHLYWEGPGMEKKDNFWLLSAALRPSCLNPY